MPKRRNVIMGLGALVFGSGATTMSGAFSSEFASPEADLRVIADAQLRVRSARDGNGNPIVSTETTETEIGTSSYTISDTGSLSTDFSTFYSNDVNSSIDDSGMPEAAAIEINEAANDQLGIRSAFTTRLDGEIDPLLEVTNNSGTPYAIKINYAQNDGSATDEIVSGGPNGYGSNVNAPEATTGEYSSSGTNELSRQDVQGIYQFRLTGESPNGRNDVSSSDDGTLISPDPAHDGSSNPADEGANTYELGDGNTAFIKLDFDTDAYDADGDDTDDTDLVGRINSAVGGASNPFDDNSDLDLLDAIYLSASEVSS